MQSTWCERCAANTARCLGMATLFVLLLAGCGGKPTVSWYQNDRHGLRFAPPGGWTLRGRGEGGGKGNELESLLVQYKRLQAGNMASLRVTVADVPGTAILAQLVCRHAPGSRWRLEGAAQATQMNG